MYEYFDLQHKDLLESIKGKDGLTDELKAALSKAMDDYKEQFKATQAVATA
jgi:F0F1-type ATP synthase alpha subunit